MDKIILSRIKCLLKPIIYTFDTVHNSLEDYIDRTTIDHNLKIKKKMLIYYVYTTIIYSLCLPIFNPYANILHAVLYSILALAQLLMLKVQDYRILNVYFMVYTFLSIYLPVTKDDECLKAVSVALMHHNLLFLSQTQLSSRLFISEEAFTFFAALKLVSSTSFIMRLTAPIPRSLSLW